MAQPKGVHGQAGPEDRRVTPKGDRWGGPAAHSQRPGTHLVCRSSLGAELARQQVLR